MTAIFRRYAFTLCEIDQELLRKATEIKRHSPAPPGATGAVATSAVTGGDGPGGDGPGTGSEAVDSTGEGDGASFLQIAQRRYKGHGNGLVVFIDY